MSSTVWKRKIVFKLYLPTCLLFFALITPTTAPYKSFVRSLWYPNHSPLVYYLNRNDADLAVQVGDYYFTSGAVYDLGKAKASYERAIELDPSIRLAHYELARIYFVQGDFEKATEYINQELVIDPYTLRPLYVRGLIELSEGDFAAAEGDFTHFVAWSPGEWGGYNDLAYTLAKEAKFPESEAILRQALLKVPDAETNPWLWNGLGLAQLNQLKYQDAARSFSNGAKYASAVTPAQWQRAYSANDPGATEASIFAFQQSVEKNLAAAKRGDTLGE